MCKWKKVALMACWCYERVKKKIEPVFVLCIVASYFFCYKKINENIFVNLIAILWYEKAGTQLLTDKGMCLLL